MYRNLWQFTIHQNDPMLRCIQAKRDHGKAGLSVQPLRIEAKLIENLFPVGLEDDELHFNKPSENA